MRFWCTNGIIYVSDQMVLFMSLTTPMSELFFSFLVFAPNDLIVRSSKPKNYAVTFVFCFTLPNTFSVFAILFQQVHCSGLIQLFHFAQCLPQFSIIFASKAKSALC